jgi:hypothetical protein
VRIFNPDIKGTRFMVAVTVVIDMSKDMKVNSTVDFFSMLTETEDGICMNDGIETE